MTVYLQVHVGRAARMRRVGPAGLGRLLIPRIPVRDDWLATMVGCSRAGLWLGVDRYASEPPRRVAGTGRSPVIARRDPVGAGPAAWWASGALPLIGRTTMVPYPDVAILADEGSGEAGFVRVAVGRARDLERFRRVRERMAARMTEVRPDLLGVVVGLGPAGSFVDLTYCADEGLVRAAERGETDPEIADLAAELDALTETGTAHDLARPWLFSPVTVAAGGPPRG